MTIRMTMQWAGVTPAQYDAVHETVGWERDHPAGGRLHVCWFDDAGLCVMDIWDTAEQFHAFVEARLMPGVAQVGLAGQPTITIEPLHEYQSVRSPRPGDVMEAGVVQGVGAVEWLSMKAAVGWEIDAPTGAVLHTACVRPEGVANCNVWVDEAAHDTFGLQRIAPVLQAVGAPMPEEGPVFPIYAVFDPAAVPVH